VLGRDTLQGNNEIFQAALLLLLLGGFAVHEVVEADGALEEVVDTTHDAEDTEGENPDTDDGDDTGLTTDEPTEETEEGSNDIDDQNGAAELPRRNRRPEGTVGTGDEDEPVLSQGDLEEEDLVENTEVLDDTAVLISLRVAVVVDKHGGKGDPGTDSKNDTEKDGHTPKLGQVPLDGGL